MKHVQQIFCSNSINDVVIVLLQRLLSDSHSYNIISYQHAVTFSVTMEEQQRKKITKKRFEKSQYTVSTLKMNNINNNKLYIVICLRMEHLRVHKKSLKSVCAFQIELEFGSVKERGKLEYPGKNLLEQGREPRRHFTHIWRQHQDLNQGHISGRQVLSPLCHPC